MKPEVKYVSIRRHYGYGCPPELEGAWKCIPLDSRHNPADNPYAGIVWEYLSDCQDDCRAMWNEAIICVDTP